MIDSLAEDEAKHRLFLSIVHQRVTQTRHEEEKRSLEKTLKRAANYDRLTGVLNRYGLEMAFEEPRRHLSRDSAIKENKPDLVAVVDLDNFKGINDNFGHGAGDDALRNVAAILESSIRDEDVVGRFGGDEFMLFLYGATPEEGIKVMRDVFSQAEIFQQANPGLILPSLSVGLGLVNYMASDFKEMYSAADRGAYQAKKVDGDQVCFYHVALPE